LSEKAFFLIFTHRVLNNLFVCKTLSCVGGHLGFPINTKNENFVENHQGTFHSCSFFKWFQRSRNL